MSYVRSGGVLEYFMPAVALATTTIGVLREMDIGATAADHGEMLCIRPCILKRVSFTPVGELAGGTTTAPTVIFKRRPTPQSATGEVLSATIIVPDATAIGATIVKSDLAVAFAVGDSMEISHTVGVGTPTGIGFWGAEFEDDPETVAGNTGVTETA